MHRRAGGRRLVLDRGVALQLGDADQAQERQHQLVQGGHRTVGEDRRRCPGRGRRPGSPAAASRTLPRDVTGHVAVGDHLVVGDHQADLHSGGLQPYPVGERSDVVAQMQRAGGTIAGQYPQGGRIGRHLLLDGVAARLAARKVSLTWTSPFTGPIAAANGFCRVESVPTIGVAIAIPEPWASQLQHYRASIGDTTADEDPHPHHAGPADRGRRRRRSRSTPTSPTSRPVHGASSSTCAAPAPSARSRRSCS